MECFLSKLNDGKCLFEYPGLIFSSITFLTVVLILGGLGAENDLNLLLGVKRKTSEPRAERMECEEELFCMI